MLNLIKKYLSSILIRWTHLLDNAFSKGSLLIITFIALGSLAHSASFNCLPLENQGDFRFVREFQSRLINKNQIITCEVKSKLRNNEDINLTLPFFVSGNELLFKSYVYPSKTKNNSLTLNTFYIQKPIKENLIPFLRLLSSRIVHGSTDGNKSYNELIATLKVRKISMTCGDIAKFVNILLLNHNIKSRYVEF